MVALTKMKCLPCRTQWTDHVLVAKFKASELPCLPASISNCFSVLEFTLLCLSSLLPCWWLWFPHLMLLILSVPLNHGYDLCVFFSTVLCPVFPGWLNKQFRVKLSSHSRSMQASWAPPVLLTLACVLAHQGVWIHWLVSAKRIWAVPFKSHHTPKCALFFTLAE